MAYQKINWQNNVTALSAENFNHMEDGIFNLSALFDNSIGYKVKFGVASVDCNVALTGAGPYTYGGSTEIDIGTGFTNYPTLITTHKTASPFSAQTSTGSWSSVNGTFTIYANKRNSGALEVFWIAIGT